MADQELDYRLWRDGAVWRWQMLRGRDVLSSGAQETSVAARVAAFRFCLKFEQDKKKG